MQIIIRNKEIEQKLFINNQTKQQGILLLGSPVLCSTVDCELNDEFRDLGVISLEFDDGCYTLRQVEKLKKLKGRLNKRLSGSEIFLSEEIELILIPSSNSVRPQPSTKVWDYNLIPVNPEHPQYVRRLLGFLKEVVESEQIAIFHRRFDHLHLLAQSGLQIKNQAEELIYQYIKEVKETIVFINMHTHTMLFNAGLEPVDFHIVRQSINTDSEILVYLPLPSSEKCDQLKFSQVKCLVQLCAQSLALHLSMKYSSSLSTQSSMDQKKLIGQSEPIQRLNKLVEKLQNTRINSLITGEESSGKKLVLQTIIEKDGLQYKKVNCKVLDHNSIYKVLFSRGEGAFHNNFYQGIVLENVHLFPPELTSEFLEKASRNELRVLATSELPEHKLLEQDLSSEFIHYIGEMILNVPSLSERVEDIPELASVFLEQFCKRNNLTQKYFSPEFILHLQTKSFKGNLAELRSYIHRQALLAEGKVIYHQNIPNKIAPPDNEFSWDLKKAKDEFALKQAHKALAVSQNNRIEAAKLLNISPRSLYRMLADTSDMGDDKIVNRN